MQDSLIISFAEGAINEEEFLFLYEEYKSVNPFYPFWEFETFCLEFAASYERINKLKEKQTELSKHCTRMIFPHKKRISCE